jgi:hypothetical protein
MAEEEPFKVRDRRGRADDDPPAPEAPSPPADARVSREVSEPPAAPAGEADLQGLLMMFATSALVSLGEAPDPASGEHLVDLDQAKEAIDILLLLRDKTQGNRSDLETRLLDQILYDLQLRFVQVAKDHAPGG